MFAPKQIGLVEAIVDMATGGEVVLATAVRAEQLRAVVVTQTTADQIITLPAPTDATVVFSVDVMNAGTVAFAMYGVTIGAAQKARFGWNGVAWVVDAAPTSGKPTLEHLVPTADNTVPNLTAAPKAGGPISFHVNGVLVSAGIISDAAGAITITPATLGYNVSVTDVVSVKYYQ